METAKVDIRKLQLLNDRVSQCIDALNQVRLTVHGLSHSSPIGVGGIGAESSPMNFPQTLSQDPRFAGTQWGTGLSHSTPAYGQMTPGLAQGIGQPFFGQIPGQIPGQFQGQIPGQISGPFAFGQQTLGGPYGSLSHSSLDFEAYNRPTWADPFLAARVAQTFPYARFAAPPVVAIY